jgi:hypothetical protein
MANINLGPASTSTASATAVLAPAQTPNFGNLYQGAQALRCVAFQKAVPVNALGTVAAMPVINATAMAFGYTLGVVIAANPGSFVNGVFTPGTAAACNLGLWTGSGGTGTALTTAGVLTGLTGASAAASAISIAENSAYYLTSTWGVGGAASNYIYVNTTVVSATATQIDLFVYAFDLSQ